MTAIPRGLPPAAPLAPKDAGHAQRSLVASEWQVAPGPSSSLRLPPGWPGAFPTGRESDDNLAALAQALGKLGEGTARQSRKDAAFKLMNAHSADEPAIESALNFAAKRVADAGQPPQAD